MQNAYDLIIIGAGPAGLSAAVYAGRAKMKTLVLEKAAVGGQIKVTAEISNYPGILAISGQDLSNRMKRQAENYGVNFVADEVESVDFDDSLKVIETKSGESYQALSIIIATGATPKKLGFEGESDFIGRGVSYCVTCDGEFFTGKEVFVIGGERTAADEALYLSRFARKVNLVVRDSILACSKTSADLVMTNPKIEIKYNTELLHVKGIHRAEEAKFFDNTTLETWVYKPPPEDGIFGVFIFKGHEPLSQAFKGHVRMNTDNYILVNEEMETNIPGVCAVGDIRPKRLKQIVTASADGAIAATYLESYVINKKVSMGLDEIPLSKKAMYISAQAKTQIKYVMARCENQISVTAILDECELSEGLARFLSEFSQATNKVTITIIKRGESQKLEKAYNETSKSPLYPAILLMEQNGEFSGVSFSGVPGGHELESFILAIYNLSGPGQAIDENLLNRIKNIKEHLNLKIWVSLSCTMCPEVVQAAQRLAILNPNISSCMVDLAHFPELKETHNVMSVPMLLINDDSMIFGKKSLEDLVGVLEDRG